jgi:DNA-binding transcriptional ArsR family regulator
MKPADDITRQPPVAQIDAAFLQRLQAAMDRVGHPVRLRLLVAIDAAGKLSPNGYRMRSGEGESLATIAYHVRTLYSHGLVARAGQRQVRGATEHFYRLSAQGRQVLASILQPSANDNHH